ncbi:hypothetical protein [Nodularia sphaerocarpa]|uniref:hypothetical protein n=1 Tax=Nodularia sphaerocarpa TaxID=137816 RepID=UPI00232FADF6|nr:hypothetical protein [Nodularia sphaerocarpa]MDB9372712.1 hypothetical protein [Nodularia sphaerocarpa CS-585]
MKYSPRIFSGVFPQCENEPQRTQRTLRKEEGEGRNGVADFKYVLVVAPPRFAKRLFEKSNLLQPTSTALSVNWRLEVVATQTKPALWLTPRYANDKCYSELVELLSDHLRGLKIPFFH